MSVDFSDNGRSAVCPRRKELMDVQIEIRYPKMDRNDVLSVFQKALAQHPGAQGLTYIVTWLKACPSTACFNVTRRGNGLTIKRIDQ